MTNHDEWTDTLSEYLDGELPPDQMRAVEAHLAGCPECAAVLRDLEAVVAHARRIEPRTPQVDLWPGINERIDAGQRPATIVPFRMRASQRFTFSLPQLAAASLLIAAMSGGFVWTIAKRSAARSTAVATGTSATNAAPAIATAEPAIASDAVMDRALVEPVGLADQQYDAAVADLEKALKQGRGRLDAATIAIVEHNLSTIDEAIRQAREALAADPANSYLSGHLVEARRRKLDLLRRATALTSESD
jgi:anti-sigma factor RsiW